MTRDALLLELEAARAQLLDSQRDLAVERARRTAAEQALSERAAEIERLLAENAELRQRVDLLARKMFGKSSEKLHPQQLSLLFETALEQEAAAHAEDARETALGEETPATPKPKRVRPSQKPAHKDLPVREVRIDPPAEQLRCGCGHDKTRIGEESSEVVDYVPASCHVVRTVRGKYACPACQDGVVIAPVPPVVAVPAETGIPSDASPTSPRASSPTTSRSTASRGSSPATAWTSPAPRWATCSPPRPTGSSRSPWPSSAPCSPAGWCTPTTLRSPT